MAFSVDRLGDLVSSECVVGPAGQQAHHPKLDDADVNWFVTKRPNHYRIHTPLVVFGFAEEIPVVSQYQFAVFGYSVVLHRYFSQVLFCFEIILSSKSLSVAKTTPAISRPPPKLNTDPSMGPPHAELDAGEIFFVDVDFEEAGEPLEVAVGFDVTDHSDQGFRIDQLFELDVVKLKLAGDGDHHPIKTLLD
jgi:hypothetical protein